MRMRVACRGLGAVVVTMTVATPGAAAQDEPSRVTCRYGTTIVQQGPLRIFGVAERSSTGYSEFVYQNVFACLHGGRPQPVGDVGTDHGTLVSSIDGLAVDGSRYIASVQESDGEGGPSAEYGVLDLKTHHHEGFAEQLAGLHETPAFRVLRDGAQLTSGDNVHLVPFDNQAGPGTLLSTHRVHATEVALNGATAYWTEHPKGRRAVARKQLFPGNAGTPPDTLIGRIYNIPHWRSRCERHHGMTVARSQQVRVFARGTTLLACRDDAHGIVALSPSTRARDLRIVEDRWLLSLSGRLGRVATVYDMKRHAMVTRVRHGAPAPAASWTLVRDGTLAWFGPDGALRMKTARARRQTLLARASARPTALAAANHTVYWTAHRVAHRFPTG